jgi:hypothetical protein
MEEIENRENREIKFRVVHNGFFYCVGQVAKRTLLNILRNPMLFIGRIF